MLFHSYIPNCLVCLKKSNENFNFNFSKSVLVSEWVGGIWSGERLQQRGKLCRRALAQRKLQHIPGSRSSHWSFPLPRVVRIWNHSAALPAFAVDDFKWCSLVLIECACWEKRRQEYREKIERARNQNNPKSIKLFKQNIFRYLSNLLCKRQLSHYMCLKFSQYFLYNIFWISSVFFFSSRSLFALVAFT